MARRWTPRLVLASVVGLVLAAGAAGAAIAAGTQDDMPTPTNGGDITEDYSYPGATASDIPKHVRLISGDGHLLLTSCNTSIDGNVGVITVWFAQPDLTDMDDTRVCFKATAATGVLNLEVPAVYEIDSAGFGRDGGHPVSAKVRDAAGKVVSVPNIAPDVPNQVGVGSHQGEVVLVQLKIGA